MDSPWGHPWTVRGASMDSAWCPCGGLCGFHAARTWVACVASVELPCTQYVGRPWVTVHTVVCGHSVGFPWSQSVSPVGNPVDSPWGAHERSLGRPWVALDCPRGVHEQFVARLWTVRGQSMGCLWAIGEHIHEMHEKVPTQESNIVNRRTERTQGGRSKTRWPRRG